MQKAAADMGNSAWWYTAPGTNPANTRAASGAVRRDRPSSPFHTSTRVPRAKARLSSSMAPPSGRPSRPRPQVSAEIPGNHPDDPHERGTHSAVS